MKILLSILFLNCFIYCKTQNLQQSFFTKQDFEQNSGKVITKYIQIRNGENNLSTVKVDLYISPNFSKDYVLQLNNIINSISENAKYNLENPSTYIPRNIVLRKRENDWYTNLFYSGQNNLGAKSDTSSMVIVNDEGKIIRDFEKTE